MGEVACIEPLDVLFLGLGGGVGGLLPRCVLTTSFSPFSRLDSTHKATKQVNKNKSTNQLRITFTLHTTKVIFHNNNFFSGQTNMYIQRCIKQTFNETLMHYTNKTQCILPANAKRISASHGCFHSKYFADYCKLFVASKFASHSRKYLTGPNTQNINLLAM